jgi:hypothetical protein
VGGPQRDRDRGMAGRERHIAAQEPVHVAEQSGAVQVLSIGDLVAVVVVVVVSVEPAHAAPRQHGCHFPPSPNMPGHGWGGCRGSGSCSWQPAAEPQPQPCRSRHVQHLQAARSCATVVPDVPLPAPVCCPPACRRGVCFAPIVHAVLPLAMVREFSHAMTSATR